MTLLSYTFTTLLNPGNPQNRIRAAASVQGSSNLSYTTAQRGGNRFWTVAAAGRFQDEYLHMMRYR